MTVIIFFFFRIFGDYCKCDCFLKSLLFRLLSNKRIFIDKSTLSVETCGWQEQQHSRSSEDTHCELQQLSEVVILHIFFRHNTKQH